jgi:NAD-dependent SIR2 family protein deacetylase
MDIVGEEEGRLAELVGAGRLLVLTGAGISTDSGIPDYRGPDGRQRHADPMTYERFVGSRHERRRYWARSHLGWGRVRGARPNAGHLAVAELERAGLLTGVVTQNVDGLHTRAGSRRVVDLHGRLDVVTCLGCGRRRSRYEIALRLDAVNPGFRESLADDPGVVRPDGDVALAEELVDGFRVVDCRRCGGVLKPDVVFFGEAVPRERFRRALAMLGRSSSLLVLGSSLAVGSGYRFVTAATKAGLPVGIANLGPTRGDHHATVRLDAPLGEVLPALARAVLDGSAPESAAGQQATATPGALRT